MPKMKGAEIITDYLIRSRIPYVFGICGHGNVGMLDSPYDARDRITLISPRHEQVAAHMADAYFRIRHEPAATLTSCGPGSANIAMALAVALFDASAILAITANVPTSQFNRSPFQEINVIIRRTSSMYCVPSSSAASSQRASICCPSRFVKRPRRCCRDARGRCKSTSRTTFSRRRMTSSCRR
jgi:thiamine pyrophosphate-dependent acetolactate synthase large subunit-like protein